MTFVTEKPEWCVYPMV